MALTAPMPTQGQIIVDVADMSLAKDIKKAIGMLRGVTKVTLPRRRRLTGYEQALRDVEQGNVYEAESVDDMFRQILGKDYVPA